MNLLVFLGVFYVLVGTVVFYCGVSHFPKSPRSSISYDTNWVPRCPGVITPTETVKYVEGVIDTHQVSIHTIIVPITGWYRVVRRDGTKFRQNYNAGDVIGADIISAERE